MPNDTFNNDIFNTIFLTNKLGYKESKPLINHLVNTSREFFFVQSRYLIIIISTYLIIQKIIPIIIFNVILGRFLRKKNIQSISLGFFILNFFTRIQILLKNGSKILISKMKIQKKLIDDSGMKSLLIDLIDVNLSFPKFWNGEKAIKREETAADTNEEMAIEKFINFLQKLDKFDLKPFLKNKFIALLAFKLFFPLQFSLQKVRLNFGSLEFYADYISIRLSYSQKKQTVIFSFFVHELNNYKNMNLKNFEYEIEAEWAHDKINHSLGFGNYSSSFKFANLTITSNTLNPSSSKETHKKHHANKNNQDKLKGLCQNRDDVLKKYGESFTKICSYL